MTDAETIAELRAELASVKAERDDIATGNLVVQHAAAKRNEDQAKVIAEMLALIRRCAKTGGMTVERDLLRAFIAGYEKRKAMTDAETIADLREQLAALRRAADESVAWWEAKLSRVTAERDVLQYRLAQEIKCGHRYCTHDNCKSSGTDCPANLKEVGGEK